MDKIRVRNHLIETVLSCHTYTPEYEKSTRLHAEYEADKLLNSGVTVLPKVCWLITENYSTGKVEILYVTVTHAVYDQHGLSAMNVKLPQGKCLEVYRASIGDTCFFTKEEAECKLMEVLDNGKS